MFNCYMYLPSQYAMHYYNIWIDEPLCITREFLDGFCAHTYYDGYGDFLANLGREYNGL